MSRAKMILKKAAKIIPLVLVFSILFSVVMPIASASGWRATPASNPFSDVRPGPGQWYHDYISWAWINGVTTGTSPTTFVPGRAVTRGQFATFLWRIAGRPQASPAHSFTDVPSGQFFSTPVAWAHSNNIVEGLSPTTFGTDRAITREQLAAMLFRYIRHIGGDTSSAAGALDRFTDRGSVSSWATGYMQWTASQGILGVGTNELDPRGNARRSHVVATLRRVVNMFSIDARNLPPLDEIPGALRELHCWVFDGEHYILAEGLHRWCIFGCDLPDFDLVHPRLRSDYIQFFGLPFIEYLESRFGPAEIIIAQENKRVETDYFVSHIPRGLMYLNWYIPVLEEIIIPFIHDKTGLYLPDSGEKFTLIFNNRDPWEPGYQSGYVARPRSTGIIEMGIDIRPNDFEGRARAAPLDSWCASNLMFTYFYIMAHEYVHVLSFAFTKENRPYPSGSLLHEEGHAMYVDAVTVRDIFGIGARGMWEESHMTNDFAADLISYFAHNRLAYALSSHSLDTSLNNPYQIGRLFGALFYNYLYENHGNLYAIEILTAMNRREPSQTDVLSIINDILGIDISETFPVWIDENRNLVTPAAITA